MFLKAKSITLKAFPTCGSNFFSITFAMKLPDSLQEGFSKSMKNLRYFYKTASLKASTSINMLFKIF